MLKRARCGRLGCLGWSADGRSSQGSPDGPVQWMIVGATCGSEGLLPQPLLATRFGAGNKEAAFVMCGRARRRARIAGAQVRARFVFVRKSRANPSPLEALACALRLGSTQRP